MSLCKECSAITPRKLVEEHKEKRRVGAQFQDVTVLGYAHKENLDALIKSADGNCELCKIIKSSLIATTQPQSKDPTQIRLIGIPFPNNHTKQAPIQLNSILVVGNNKQRGYLTLSTVEGRYSHTSCLDFHG
jgi:hypothetical protein